MFFPLAAGEPHCWGLGAVEARKTRLKCMIYVGRKIAGREECMRYIPTILNPHFVLPYLICFIYTTYYPSTIKSYNKHLLLLNNSNRAN